MDPRDLHVRLIAGIDVPGDTKEEVVSEPRPSPQEYDRYMDALSEFVTRARCGKSFAHLAREYGGTIATVHGWVTQALADDVAEVSGQEADELDRLRERNAKLETECERWAQALADDIERCGEPYAERGDFDD